MMLQLKSLKPVFFTSIRDGAAGCWQFGRVAALAAVAEGTIRYVASDDLRRSGKNDFSMHWLFGERFFSFCS